MFLRLNFLFIGMILSGCTPQSSVNTTSPPLSRVVHLVTWGNYVSLPVLEEFKAKTGIEVKVSLYSSNEELLAKLQAGASGYDVAVPSDYMVSVMRHLDLLQNLDLNQIPELKNVDSRFKKLPFDPENQVSVPWDWGTTGIAINRKYFKGKVKGWKDVLGAPELEGKLTLLDDVRETVGMALKVSGASLNSTDASDLAKAKVVLSSAKKKVKAFTSEPMSGIVSGDFWVSHMYSSDALQARQKTQGEIEYLIPEEGATYWVDTLVIPKGAAHISEAHQLINYLMSAEVSKVNVERLFVAPTQDKVISLLPKALQRDSGLLPKMSKKLEMLHDLGGAMAQWDRLWTEVKVQ